MTHMIAAAKPRIGRSGFTLIEMLVVIFIMIILASLALVLAPRLKDDQKTTRATDHMQGWLFVAKQEAYRDKLPRGVRLVPDTANGNPTWVKECLYIEQPEEFRGGFVQIPPPQNQQLQQMYPPPPQFNTPQQRAQWQYAWAFVTGANGLPLNLENGDVVLPGDFFVLDVSPYGTYRIAFRKFLPQFGGTLLYFAAADDNYINNQSQVDPYYVPAYVTNSSNPVGSIGPGERGFHIIRQSRPRAGESSLKLPKDIIVDLNLSSIPAMNLNVTDNLDVLFNPNGGVMGSNALGGKVVLWIVDSSKPRVPQVGANPPPSKGENNLIAVYNRTGFIAAHPANISNYTNPPAYDPFSFVRDGKSSGM